MKPKLTLPLVIELYCGTFGWSAGWLEMGGWAVGFDIEHEPHHGDVPKGAHLVIQDVTTLHGSQFRNASLILASPPCTEYSYMAMPWKRAKQIAAALRGLEEFPEGYTGSRTIAQLNRLFDACFRIQKEACEATCHCECYRCKSGGHCVRCDCFYNTGRCARYIPMVVENVRGAQPWVGQAKANFGSYYLWGDVGMVGKRVVAGVPQFGVSVAPMRSTKNGGGSWFAVAHNTESGHSKNPVNFPHEGNKTAGMNWSNRELHGQDFTRIAGQQAARKRTPDGTDHGSGSWFKIADSKNRGAQGVKDRDMDGYARNHDAAFGWKAPRTSSRSNSRKAASAQIAKIPFPLAQHIAQTFLSSV